MPEKDDPSDTPPAFDAKLGRLRQWRNRAEPDYSMNFLAGYFKREVEKPHKQLGALGEIWRQLVPAELAEHTRLESLSRGVLRIAVDSSSRLYQLDRLLRAGLEQRIIQAHRGPAFRKILLRVAEEARGQSPGDQRPAAPRPDDDPAT